MSIRSINSFGYALCAGFAVALTTATVVSCDVHEFPEECEKLSADTTTVDTGVDVVLELDYSTELPLYQEVEYTTRSSEDGYCLRYLINIYEPESDGSYGRTYSQQMVITRDDVNALDTCVTLHMEPGEYKFIVWTDYIDYGTEDDKYYDTSDFAEIALTDQYEGSTDYRDAFKGTQTGTVYEGCDTIVVEMGRPLAKFEYITTDLERFIEKVAKMMAEQEETRSADLEELAQTIDLSSYSVVIAYTAYMPYSFNIFTDRPADSMTGVYFYGSLTEIGNGQARLGFDYVFVNGMATSVQTALYVYDSSGTLIASTDVITVPLLRSHLTTVYGEFLTSEASGGIGIDPNYDGEYNIEID